MSIGIVENEPRGDGTVGLGERSDRLRRFFSFPDPVNETAARVVATGVVAQVLLFLVVREGWLLVPLVVGFVARVSSGPLWSPLGRLAVQVVTPRIEARTGPGRRVPGPPKRFAQAIGVVFSTTAGVAWLVGAPTIATVVLVGLLAAATLEAAAAVCLGCIVYDRIWGCPDCFDVSGRLAESTLSSTRR